MKTTDETANSNTTTADIAALARCLRAHEGLVEAAGCGLSAPLHPWEAEAIGAMADVLERRVEAVAAALGVSVDTVHMMCDSPALAARVLARQGHAERRTA